MRDFTDSYCERCGTRYTFGQTPPKGPSLASARLLARGLKNFVMNDSATIDEAMAAARIDEEQTLSTRVTEEFHRVFNFCMTCRQYACDKCWNPNQGACLSCAPLWDTEPVVPEGHLILRTPAAHKGLGAIAPTTRPEPMAAAPASWQAEPPPGDRPERRGRSARTAQEPVATAGYGRTGPVAGTPGGVAERRAAARDREAAQELQTQSESWKSQDDGWSLWPAGENHEKTGPSLTQQEFLLVHAQLDNPSPYEEPDEPPRRQAAPPKRATAREPRSSRRTEPAAAQQPSSGPSDLSGSPRAARLDAPSGPAPEPGPVPTEPRRSPVLGRLLGHQPEPARDEARSAGKPKPAKPARAAKPGRSHDAPSAPAILWPHATPWSERPTGQAGPAPTPSWQAETAPPAAAEPEPPATPTPAFPPQTHRPAPARRAVELERAVEQPAARAPLFGAADRPAAETPQAPPAEPRTTAGWPAADSGGDQWAGRADAGQSTPATAPGPVAGAGDAGQEPWAALGAQRPGRDARTEPWPIDESQMPASVVAARGQAAAARQSQLDESMLIEALWAESAQKVLDRGSVRVCFHCSLPLSTHARFCRRCGTDQHT